MGDHDADDPIRSFEEAIRFMAAHGNAERALRQHRMLSDGMCSGCLTQLMRWPCPIATLAMTAQEREQRRPHDR
jgi:hypothetical protein